MNSTVNQILAYDIGGSHITAALVNTTSLTIRAVESSAIDSAASQDTILTHIENTGRRALRHTDSDIDRIVGIACAFPSPFDYPAGVSLMEHKYHSLYQVNLKQELSRRFCLPESTIIFIHDAQAFLMGEIHHGGAQDADRVIGITLGTGIGSAFAIGRQIVDSGPGVPIGGEIYALPWKDQTIEDFISTRSIRTRFCQLSGCRRSVREIAESAPADQFAAMVFHEFGNNLGEVLNGICEAFRPDHIVLGGGISQSAHLFVPQMCEAFFECKAKIVTSGLQDLAAIIGGAVCWSEARRSRGRVISSVAG